jgi:hypothetical protein
MTPARLRLSIRLAYAALLVIALLLGLAFEAWAVAR